MKLVLRVSPAQAALARWQARDDEARGVDPGQRWHELYPQVTEIEFVVDATLEKPNA